MQLGRPSKGEGSMLKHVNEYIQYCNLVGDNGGVMMSQKEYQLYKKNYTQLAQNRLYTNWYNAEKVNCKTIGPSSKCFCDHPYKNHDYLQGANNKAKCKMQGCKCNDYTYIPIYGSQDFKCSCKHSYQTHDIVKKNCKQCACKCFVSSWSCTCGMSFKDHKTVSQRKQQKQQKGQVVNSRQGGVVSYSSILDGVQKFEHGINEQIKKKGMKVKIEQFVIGKKLQLNEQISAWQLMNRPLSWMK